MSGVSFPIKLQASGKKKGTQTQKQIPTQMFSVEFFEIFKNIFLTEHLRAPASETHLLVPQKLQKIWLNFTTAMVKKLPKSICDAVAGCREHSKKLTRTMVFLWWFSWAGFLRNNCKRLPDKCSDLNCVVRYFREKWMTLKSCVQQFVFDRIINQIVNFFLCISLAIGVTTTLFGVR